MSTRQPLPSVFLETMKVVVVGSLNFDLVTTVKVAPKGGETIQASGFATHYGGKGANQAYALSRLLAPKSTEVAMVGCVGDDSFGQELVDHLRQSGVETSQVERLKDEKTGVATIIVESNGENRIMVYPGANGKVTKADTKITDEVDFVVLQNEIPLETTLSVLKKAEHLKTRSVLNPSPLPELPLKDWPFVDVLVVNEGEAGSLTDAPVNSKDSAIAALPKLLAVSGLCVVTLGANGVVWQEKGKEPEFEPAYKVSKVVDTTGAGDTFLAALVSQLTAERPSMRQCIAFAAKAAAIAVTREGAASSIPSLEEVKN